jgi:hypothetical protein
MHPRGLPPRFLRTTAHRWASVFLWLWLGHMYMESKGLPMHSPRSLVYNETLASSTRAVYPLDYCVSLALCGHIYKESKGFPMHSSRSPVYGKTLARCTRAVYPPRFLRTAAHRWASVLLWLWLGHMYMESKGFTTHSPQNPVYRKL